MSVDPVIFRALVANGATPELLLAVVEAAAAAEEDRKAAKRAGNAERQQRFRDRNARNALLGVTQCDGVTSPAPSPSSSPDPSNNPTPTLGDITPRARKASAWPVPEGVEPRHWSDFLANRKRKRLVNSQTALDGVMKDLAENADDAWPPGKLVELAAAKGWGSINYPSDQPRNGNRNEAVRSNRGTASRPLDGFTSALREASGYHEADYRH